MPVHPDAAVLTGSRGAWGRVVVSGTGPQAPGADVSGALREADRLRDARCFAEAARAYGEILTQAPERADLRVQLGNMLKDSGRPKAAVEAYRSALGSRPDDPDTHLQLGHALKALGRRSAALETYREAARLGAGADADRELAAMGEVAEQNRLFAAQPWAEALRQVADLRAAVEDLRRKLDRTSAALPALGSLLAVPVEAYDTYRAALAIPPAPSSSARPMTVLCRADEGPPGMLDRQIASVRRQVHGAWRLLVLGRGAGDARAAVERQRLQDGRIGWVAAEGPVAAAELSTACLQDGPVLLLARGAVLDPSALSWFAHAFDLAEAEAFVCDDEVVADEDGRPVHRAPVLRQVVDADTLIERNAFGETIVVAADALRARRAAVLTTSIAAARSSLLLDLAHDAAVGHIPFPLVHTVDEGPPDRAAHAAAVVAHGTRMQARFSRPSVLPAAARIAVVVPTRDNARDVEIMVASLRATAAEASSLDIVILDNGGTDPGHRAILDRLAARGDIRRIAVDEPFNWSRLNNLGAAASDAPLLVFANDDMCMLTPGWDTRLRSLLARAEVGAVGAKLLYPDGSLQHAGILFGWTPTPTHHDGLHRPGDDPGPAGRWGVTRAVSAVTGAFLATRRDAFMAAGGFDAVSLPVGYGDVDYALRLRAAGLRILWTPHILLRHHESKTRGLDHLEASKSARAEAEDRAMLRRWPGLFAHDPGVHPAWRPETLPFRLLDPWSAARAAAHIERTGRRRPWLVACPETRADDPGATRPHDHHAEDQR